MSYRGSLTQCIHHLGILWRQNQHPYLSIISHPRAKYYSTCTDDELDKPQYQPETGDCRLVFRGTLRELAVFMSHPQTNMIKELSTHAPKTDNQDREQPGGNGSG
ncbi:hypothetical protein LCGC14_1239450 [marine sediment metagenome]|uniref:Uncharacterized protein n=1 Tax=marine sediment metagenome TaxID=412755 RepID=A0A0F9NNG5_9ZZZZ